ncbi:hypothetical protein BHMPCIPO_00230 [Ensifer sesbaniae]|nr:hypothetical protein [Ensifer sesbaniae]
MRWWRPHAGERKAHVRQRTAERNRSGEQPWRRARIAGPVFAGRHRACCGPHLVHRRRGLKGNTPAGRGRSRQERRGHAASEKAAIGGGPMIGVLIAVAGVIPAYAERIAESVDLREGRHRTRGKCADDRLQHEQAGSDKRQSPTVASPHHNQTPSALSFGSVQSHRIAIGYARPRPCSTATMKPPGNRKAERTPILRLRKQNQVGRAPAGRSAGDGSQRASNRLIIGQAMGCPSRRGSLPQPEATTGFHLKRFHARPRRTMQTPEDRLVPSSGSQVFRRPATRQPAPFSSGGAGERCPS